MNEKLTNDLNLTFDILNKKECNNFSKIYTRSNEDLTNLLVDLNIRGKDIFTVLSSSDQLFSLLYLDAKNVDTFDINPLTYRYYFLRLWLLKNGIEDINSINIFDLYDIVLKIQSNNQCEIESIIYWMRVLLYMQKNKIDLSNLFEYVDAKIVPYTYDISYLLRVIRSYNMNFYNTDICMINALLPQKKYDYIFMSNILDYYLNENNMIAFIKNISPLLKEKGKIITSHILYTHELLNEYLKNYFDMKIILTYTDPLTNLLSSNCEFVRKK